MAQDFKSFDCLETHLFIGVLLWLSNSLDCWVEKWFVMCFFQWGIQLAVIHVLPVAESTV